MKRSHGTRTTEDWSMEVTERKKVPITVAFQLEVDVPADWDEDMIQFWVEENHCIQNHVDTLVKIVAENDARKTCTLCSRGGAVVGHWNVQELVRAKLGSGA